MSLIEVSLGALMHDIGKLMQRARNGEEGLSEQSRRMREQICPVRRGMSSHAHVLFTNEFVSGIPFWPEGVRPGEVANIAAFHHRPDTPEQAVVSEADRLSSGIDRLEAEEGAGAARLRRVRMRSVAAGVSLDGAAGVQATLRLERLSPEIAFPEPLEGDPADWDRDDLSCDYRRLWDGFVQEWSANRCPDAVGFANRAASVMERYLWCVPSAVNAFPDISLHDHSVSTAAIAGCLLASPDAERPFLLAVGDLTGIQGYVYDLRHGAGGLARRLRARSFDVGAWCEAVSLEILAQLGLPIMHRILFAGGKFHLLLPNHAEARDVLLRTRQRASEWLFKRSGGHLGLSLAWMDSGKEGLKGFSETLARLHGLLWDERDRPGQAALASEGAWREESFLLPRLEVSGEEQVCPSCRFRVANVADEGEERRAVCPECHEDGERGRRLPKSRWTFFAGRGVGVWDAPAGGFGLAGSSERCPPEARLIVDMDGQGEGPAHLPLAGGWRARHVPLAEDGTVAEFDRLAKGSQGRLGYLKMDVDNLGYLMTRGLSGEGGDRASVSRVATLSRTLELFFAGHLETLLRREYPDAYLVYSGGDDVLAIGPWELALDLAWRLRQDFRRYTAGNPAWALSAGVAVVHHHTPVLAAAQEADHLLEVSKTIVGEGPIPVPEAREARASPVPERQAPGQGAAPPAKDRVTALGVSLPWERFGAALESGRRLLGWIREGTVNTSQARRLMRYSRMHREFERTGDTRQFEYAPLLAYDIRRNWTGGTPAREEARQWAAGLGAPGSEEMQTLHFVCWYALCAARGTGEE